jgi:hypothetical protein
MGATGYDFNDANNSGVNNFVKVTIRDANAEDMAPYVITFPVNGKTWKKGKFSSKITSVPLKASFAFDTKKTKFSFSASNMDLKGLSCPFSIEIKVGNYTGAASLDEMIVNGAKPMPIKLLMGVKNSLRVDKSKFTRNKTTGNVTQAAVSGGFSAKDTAIDMAANSFAVNIGSQTFTIPSGNFKNSKGKFACSKVVLSGGEIAAAAFDFNKSTFTLTIKNTNFTAAAGNTVFGINFASFSGSGNVTLQP